MIKTMAQRSRIAIGFNRLAIVLSVPILLGAAAVAGWELPHPSGRLVTEVPEGGSGVAATTIAISGWQNHPFENEDRTG